MRFIVVVECSPMCGKPEGDIMLSMIAQCSHPTQCHDTTHNEECPDLRLS